MSKAFFHAKSQTPRYPGAGRGALTRIRSIAVRDAGGGLRRPWEARRPRPSSAVQARRGERRRGPAIGPRGSRE